MIESIYCRHCEAQIEGCLQAADTSAKKSIRSYFLMLAGKWTRLARDLESKQSCGPGCPLRKACDHERALRAPADTAPVISAMA
jgi:hypothetical protein